MPAPERNRAARKPFRANPEVPQEPRPDPAYAGTTTQAPWGVNSRVADAPAGPVGSALFVIDRSDTVLASRIAESDRWLYREADLTGRPLRAVLADINALWDKHLPPALFDDEETLYLPGIVPGTPGLVLAVHRLRCGGQMQLALVPELAPPEWLRQNGIADFTPDPATFARIFLRLRSVENRLDHYLSHLPGVVFNQRADLSFAFIGPGCETLLGLEAQALSRDSQSLLRLIHPADERGYFQELDRHASAAKPFSLVYRLLNPRTGTYLYLLDVRSPVLSAGGLLLGYEGVWLDITRQKIAEHRLTTRAWKESISSLTSGLLEEFSTAMTGICTLSELYHNTLAAKHPLRDGLGLIRDNAARAQSLLGRILELNSDTAGEKTYANLGKLVRDQLDLLKIVLPRGTQLTGPAADGDWPVLIDETACRQALVNFALNSRDALSGPGDLRITLRRLEPGDTLLDRTVPPLEPVSRPSVELVFADNGCGIEPAHLPRIFDPFFTTKDSNRGSGLGLYHARLFAEEHGGVLAVRSAPDRGTEMVLVLPLADLSLAAPQEQVETSARPPHQARILYFEPGMTDETALIDELRLPEWDLRTVSTSDHARRVLREEGVKLDLMIIRQPRDDTALRMLLAEIRRDHPGLPVALALTYQPPAELPASLRSQVDLLLPAGIRDFDAAESITRLLRKS